MKDPIMILLRNSGVDLSAYGADSYSLDDGCYFFVRYVEIMGDSAKDSAGFFLEFLSCDHEAEHGCIEVTRHKRLIRDSGNGYLQYHCHGRAYDYLDIFDAKHAKSAHYPKHLLVPTPTYDSN